MKTELDTLMQQRSLDALLVSGGTHENPCMYYLANGAKVGASTLAINAGTNPISWGDTFTHGRPGSGSANVNNTARYVRVRNSILLFPLLPLVLLQL